MLALQSLEGWQWLYTCMHTDIAPIQEHLVAVLHTYPQAHSHSVTTSVRAAISTVCEQEWLYTKGTLSHLISYFSRMHDMWVCFCVSLLECAYYVHKHTVYMHADLCVCVLTLLFYILLSFSVMRGRKKVGKCLMLEHMWPLNQNTATAKSVCNTEISVSLQLI